MVRELNCRVCGNVFLAKTSAKLCLECRAKREIIKKRERDARYKDKVRHGGERKKIIDGCGLQCSMCGKKGTRYEITTHHIMHDKDHKKQTMLCRSCHAKEHYPFCEKKRKRDERVRNMPKSEIENALINRGAEEAAQFLGISRSALFKLRKKFGLKVMKPQKIFLSKEDLITVNTLRLKEQAETLGVSLRTLCVNRQKYGLSNLPPIR